MTDSEIFMLIVFLGNMASGWYHYKKKYDEGYWWINIMCCLILLPIMIISIST